MARVLPRYRITHRTSYHYQSPVALCHNVAHLVPRTTARQSCLSTDLVVDPHPRIRRKRVDPWGNETWYFSIESPHQSATVTGQSEVVVDDEPPRLPTESPAWERIRDELSRVSLQPHGSQPDATMVDAPANEENVAGALAFPAEREFLLESPFIPISDEFADYAWQSFTPDRPIIEAMRDFTDRVYREFTFDSEATTLATPVAVVFRERRGVCQDFAHVTLACLRSIGLAARYVSGYLETDPPPGRERLVGADASHAWVSLFAGELGWFDFDPTNNVTPGGRHITLAWGRDYGDVSPLQGVILGGGAHELDVSVDVARTDRTESWENTAI